MNSAVKTASSPYLSSQEFLADKTSLADFCFETYQLMKDENISFETVLKISQKPTLRKFMKFPSPVQMPKIIF